MCPQASIINKWGTKYPKRLENCIASVNWLERKAEELDCDYIISLGDFFDKPDLTSDTITASNDIQWSSIMHYHIVGNHDASNSSLTFNSTNSLRADRHVVIDRPQVLMCDDCDICFLPYVTECDRKPLADYFPAKLQNKQRIILSHNDISGIQMGPVVSKTGFSIEEIEANCDLFLNGHLHNGQALSSKVVNLGNLTGKDFGEDAAKYSHNIAVLDTKTLSLTYLENPYAYNFYKIDINIMSDLENLKNLKSNAVVSVRCAKDFVEEVRQTIDKTSNIIESRVILVRHYEEATEDTSLDLTVDHLARFIECCKATIENSTLLEEELSEICK
jgi:DNA repair exonuclease SbcCD nuclease subunit